MASESEILSKFWKALKSDRTIMLGLTGLDAQPMTAQIEGKDDETQRGPIWFFTSKDTDLAQKLAGQSEASAQFSSKGHDVFATLKGTLRAHNDRAVIERLWNPFIAAWFEGKDDPKVQLLRFDADHVHIWLNENSLFAGVKIMLGSDPKQDYRDKTADVDLDRPNA